MSLKRTIFEQAPVRLFITQVADFVRQESWIEVQWVERIRGPIGEGETLKFRIGLDPDDPGQRLVLDGLSIAAFRIDLNDAPPGGTPSRRYFSAEFNRVREQHVGNLVKLKFDLRKISAIRRVHPVGNAEPVHA